MNLTQINAQLSERRANYVTAVVDEVEKAVAAGLVPNTLFVGAKDTFNRAVAEGVEKFLETGPRTMPGRSQSDWWLAAYDCDALVSGTHGLPVAIKRATKRGLTQYVAFLSELLPLRTLLENAKPLIKKRGELPVVRTPKQIADDAKRMTCQCCDRPIFAETGTIAHHGYERPGLGWQTASCYGAKHLPWEVSRDALGRLILNLQNVLLQSRAAKVAVANGVAPVAHHYSVWDRQLGKHLSRTVTFVRATFDAVKAETPEAFDRYADGKTFDDYKAHDLDERTVAIGKLGADIRELQARFNGWKQTHRWNGETKSWEAL